MTTTTLSPTLSVNDVKGGNLPKHATGVLWTDTKWTGRRAHLLDPSWSAGVPDDDRRTGDVLIDGLACDACAERDREDV